MLHQAIACKLLFCGTLGLFKKDHYFLLQRPDGYGNYGFGDHCDFFCDNFHKHNFFSKLGSLEYPEREEDLPAGGYEEGFIYPTLHLSNPTELQKLNE